MRRARGFTLLEVLLAVVVLALAMGLLVSMLARGLNQVKRAQYETEASLHAQSLLDSLGVIEPLAEGERSGEFEGGRYRYRLQVREVEDPVPAPEAAPGAPPAPEVVAGPKLFRIALQVDWGEGGPRQQLDYVTLRARTPPLLGASP